MASVVSSKIEFTAAHKKITLWIGANVLALLIDQLGAANRAIVPPIFLRLGLGRRRFRTIHRVVLRSWHGAFFRRHYFFSRNGTV